MIGYNGDCQAFANVLSGEMHAEGGLVPGLSGASWRWILALKHLAGEAVPRGDRVAGDRGGQGRSGSDRGWHV